MSGLAERLHDDINRAAFRIRSLNGQWNTLAILANPYDDKLSRPLLARDPRRLNREALDPRRNELGINDFEHGTSPRMLVYFYCPGMVGQEAVILVTSLWLGF